MKQFDPLSWHATYTKFRASREKIWIPKIYNNLKDYIKAATSFYSVDAAINNIHFIKNNTLSALLQDIYIDAGRVLGAKAYQLVQNQAKYKKDAGIKMRRRNGYGDPNTLYKSLLPIGYNEQLVNDIIAFMQIHGLQMVTEITDTMKEWVLKQLIIGQQQGKSIDDIADAMLKDSFPKNRAIVIARTEVIKSANYGSVLGAKKTGYKMNKQWVASQDFRTRRLPKDAFSHLAMDGIQIPIDEKFQVPSRGGGYEELMQPGDPNGSAADIIQCRCTVGFVVQVDKDGLPVKI